jgi:hypothetical protein
VSSPFRGLLFGCLLSIVAWWVIILVIAAVVLALG